MLEDSVEETIVALKAYIDQCEENERLEIFEKLLIGYCRHCFEKKDGTCWSCYDSSGY